MIFEISIFFKKTHESAFELGENLNESSNFFHENWTEKWKWVKYFWISHHWNHVNFESSIFFMKNHDAWKCIKSDIWKEWMKIQYLFMKNHEITWKCIEYHIWTGKRFSFENSIFFHENLWKRMEMEMHWIPNLNLEKSEPVFLRPFPDFVLKSTPPPPQKKKNKKKQFLDHLS